jgi:hypothetical protein
MLRLVDGKIFTDVRKEPNAIFRNKHLVCSYLNYRDKCRIRVIFFSTLTLIILSSVL